MPKKKEERDYGRRPEMFSDKRHKDYASMMRSRTDRAQWVKAIEKHSEFKKPYRGSQDYPEMEHFYPTGFDIPFVLPSLITPKPSPSMCAGAVMYGTVNGKHVAFYDMNFGESVILGIGGHDGAGNSWKDTSWSPVGDMSGRGTLLGASYKAPAAGEVTGIDACVGFSLNLVTANQCGEVNVILEVHPSATQALGAVTGPDVASIGARYSVTGGTPPYTFELLPNKDGIIDNNGQILSLGTACGAGNIKVTDSCGKTSISSIVRYPSGIWSLVSDTVYCNPAGTFAVHAAPVGDTRLTVYPKRCGCNACSASCFDGTYCAQGTCGPDLCGQYGIVCNDDPCVDPCKSAGSCSKTYAWLAREKIEQWVCP